MGRHSAPGDDDAAADDSAAAALDLGPPRRGRHASPGGDDEGDAERTQMIAVVDPDLLDAPERLARQETGQLPVLEPREAHSALAEADQAKAAAEREAKTAKSAKLEAKAAKKAERGESNTQADLRILRTNNAVRAQCLAAVVVAFGLYTLVLAVIGRLDDYLFVLPAPIVLSGIGIGVVLDLAHRRAAKPVDTVDPVDPVDTAR